MPIHCRLWGQCWRWDRFPCSLLSGWGGWPEGACAGWQQLCPNSGAHVWQPLEWRNIMQKKIKIRIFCPPELLLNNVHMSNRGQLVWLILDLFITQRSHCSSWSLQCSPNTSVINLTIKKNTDKRYPFVYMHSLCIILYLKYTNKQPHNCLWTWI